VTVADFVPPVRRINHGRGHRYVDALGAKVPGVTTIIGEGVPKPALVDWSARTTAAYAVDYWDELAGLSVSERLKRLERARFEVRDSAAVQGTKLHALADRLVAGEEVVVPPELEGHVAAYIRFLDEWQVRPILREFVAVSHEHGYAGTGDLLAELVCPEDPDRTERWLLDTKTGRSVFGEVALQLAAYRYADCYIAEDGSEQPMPSVTHTGVVHVRADGYELVPVTARRRQYLAFLYAREVAKFAAEARDLIGEPLTPPALQEAS
jgi:hypothetical protein